MFQFAKKLDFAYGGHVETIFEESDFDFLYGHFAAGRYLPA